MQIGSPNICLAHRLFYPKRNFIGLNEKRLLKREGRGIFKPEFPKQQQSILIYTNNLI